MRDIFLTNTLSRSKELFVPVNPGHMGIYVCGPTVYGDAHLGHARPGVTYDVLVRFFRHLGYKVRYVRNITDVGHLEHDADEGEDKIAISRATAWRWPPERAPILMSSLSSRPKPRPASSDR